MYRGIQELAKIRPIDMDRVHMSYIKFGGGYNLEVAESEQRAAASIHVGLQIRLTEERQG